MIYRTGKKNEEEKTKEEYYREHLGIRVIYRRTDVS